MLGPTNTAADVADILIAGLMNGSISLDGQAPTSQQTTDEGLDQLRRRKLALNARTQPSIEELKTKH
jgi:hypothetical protein